MSSDERSSLEDDLLDLEEQYVLRLPLKQAKKVKKLLRKKRKKVRKNLQLDVDPQTKEGTIIIRNKQIPLKLVDLPTITESMKTYSKEVFFKTADICQMLIPDTNAPDYSENPKNEQPWKHGITPPLKNVRKQRFSRILKNVQAMDTEDEKELHRLLKCDNEAVAVRWELIDDPDKKDEKETEEQVLFGGILSSSESSDEEL